ncbi:MAG: hypothetical protein KDJ16_03765, partial [Hyphomicrobiales bacterium]|nr:hypothetical protein [Hyphomicrobiales bacterium]
MSIDTSGARPLPNAAFVNAFPVHVYTEPPSDAMLRLWKSTSIALKDVLQANITEARRHDRHHLAQSPLQQVAPDA